MRIHGVHPGLDLCFRLDARGAKSPLIPGQWQTVTAHDAEGHALTGMYVQSVRDGSLRFFFDQAPKATGSSWIPCK